MSTQRVTAKRGIVQDALHRADGFVSAARVHDLITTAGTRIGLATVYRQLNALAETGEADTVAHPSGQLFRACTAPGEHHHHLICEDCGTAADVEPPDESWIDQTAADHGFVVTRHVMEVYGVCAACR
ncbi:Fur family transcriptional regulator [Microbacterium koreense]|uniref:Fur family transcriptional regulator n=1 Tax=Microbacterium koreense TaxID=323761 RepID=A0ABW2ZQF1_9MICO